MRPPPRPERPRVFRPDGLTEYQVRVFDEARSPWRCSYAEAKWDAIESGLASYDAERGEYYLAVPVEITRRRIALTLAA